MTGQAAKGVELLVMSGVPRAFYIGLSLAIVAVILGWGGLRFIRERRSVEVRKADVIYSITPQSRAAAQPGCPIPLPEVATNIQYVVWSFGQVTQSWTRFEAPVADCLAHAESMVRPFKDRAGYAVTMTPIVEDTGVLCVLDPTEVDLSWFEDCQSATGLVFRVSGGRAPVIWVDTNQGRFFCEIKNELHSLCQP